MATLSQINTLLLQAEQLIDSQGRAPTRTDYGMALELADAATELAVDGGCGQGATARCKNLQSRCHHLLQLSYAKTETYEKFVYDKTASRAGPKPKRCGKLFDVDKGEHLVDALRAVHIGQLLEDRESSQDRKIRFVDEVKNEPIQRVY
ncbi:hypothetical protein F4818DRAFT_405960 [Hypoxylon cercidicola]|nr:hypothetical protein F4818DRAFT_405960 [Hypoxylon cercidicola]